MLQFLILGYIFNKSLLVLHKLSYLIHSHIGIKCLDNTEFWLYLRVIVAEFSYVNVSNLSHYRVCKVISFYIKEA